MNRRLTLTIGIILSALLLLYLGGSAYHARAPFKVDTLGDLHAPTLGQADARESIIVFTDYRCPHCRAFEGTVMPELEPLVASGALSLSVIPIGMLGEDSELTAAGALCAARQGEAAFSALHKALFELPGVSQEALIALAAERGLESQQLRGSPRAHRGLLLDANAEVLWFLKGETMPECGAPARPGGVGGVTAAGIQAPPRPGLVGACRFLDG